MDLVILGPAGCGKSLLTASLRSFLAEEGYSTWTVNLDPGALTLPYEPDFDVRDRFTVSRIMEEEGLGPNGAMIRAMERIAEEVRLPKREVDFTLIDTPGQLEIFAFHRYGPKIVETLPDPLGIFMIDGTIEMKDLPVFYLLSLATQLRLEMLTVNVVNKADLMGDEKREDMRSCLLNPLLLRKIRVKGMIADVYSRVPGILSKIVPPQRIPLISAVTRFGFDELLDILKEVRCVCGDLT